MRLFAIIAQSNENSVDAKHVVETFLKKQLNSEQVKEYLTYYDEFLKQQSGEAAGEKKKRRLAVSSVKVIVICDQINEELSQKQKFIVLLNLIEFVGSDASVSEQEMEFISTVSSSFKISDEEFNQCFLFANKPTPEEMEDSSNLLVVSSEKPESKHLTKHIFSDSLSGRLGILKINSIGIYIIRYFGSSELFLNSQILSAGRTYILSPGSSIRNAKVQPIYYSDIAGCFMNSSSEAKIEFVVKNIEYKFKNGKQGLYDLSFSEPSGKMMGIMGGSGAGKSTLLNILNGNNAPSGGEVLVNGYNLHKEKEKLEGVVGYVPQDDLLIEELTVYQNLFYNSKLCFDGIPDTRIHEKVIHMLNELGLYETRDLKVGNSLDKTISGGQRKRLNIALELIREPAVLFCDEPTSGLSSRDSENIMDLLKELALKGKLVFVVIHQPSSDIFKMFDKLLILDVGGYPIYYGNPVDSVIYFKKLVNQVNADESECVACGNVNPEQVFNIIEAKVLDENGNLTHNRKVSSDEWNGFYREKIAPNTGISSGNAKHDIHNSFKKPNFINQFKVFVVRDVLSKISNTQYLAITLIEAPLLSLILAFLVKYYKNGEEYIFSENKNLPAFMFMCVLVALFVGMMVSAEEIIRDRKILKRESFLNLSKGSYLFSKVIILFFISAIQTLTFVLIGNYILEIKGMYIDYWLVLFTTSCCANMLGLNISAAFNSVVTIYILIPFLLIPQILLSGALVRFDELNPKISGQALVPFAGDMMTSRWAFEALAVNQFMNNDYEKIFYRYEKQSKSANVISGAWCPAMVDLSDKALSAKTAPKKDSILEIIRNEIISHKITPDHVFNRHSNLTSGGYDTAVCVEMKKYLAKIKKHYLDVDKKERKAKNDLMLTYQSSIAGNLEFNNLKNEYHNQKLEELVTNDGLTNAIIVEDGKLVATKDPIFRDGSSNHFIRSHFFAPRKNVFGNYYSTYWVNVAVLWTMSGFLWIMLFYDVLRNVLNYSKKLINRFI